ncbi:TetR/AcrR family transcriptional regulator [Gordonia aurantiaca]|uniref:TetR/AcrR family transcriptional regulator n=1 Tax=Gordonia sp. B21 TaxID=3151852 RepID=UPI0032643E36
MPKLIDHAERRAEIAEALWRIVLREGVSGVSVREVAAEAGISVGSLRHVFADKAELLEFSMRLIFDRVGERVGAHGHIRNPLRRAEAALSEVMPFDDNRRVEMHVNLALLTESVAHPGLAEAARDAYEGLRLLCLAVLTDLREHGLVDDRVNLDDEAVKLHALLDGMAMHMLVDERHAPTASRVLKEYLAGLAPDG